MLDSDAPSICQMSQGSTTARVSNIRLTVALTRPSELSLLTQVVAEGASLLM